MKNRTKQPAALDLPPVSNDPIRINGQLKGPMGQPLANLRILLKAITTTQEIMQETWSEATTDLTGNYDFSVMPGKYAVFYERRGLKERVNNIYVYSDSASGTLQSFMLAPSADMLTPLMVLEIKPALEESTAAMLRARQWAENPINVPVLDFEQGAGPEYSAYHWAHTAYEIINSDTNINWRGEWVSSDAYVFRDAVRYQGSSYYCIEANTNVAPPDIATADNSAWSLMSAKGDKGIPGVPGTPGTPGKDGEPGQDGEDGVDGISPDMSHYYTKIEVQNLIDADLSDYYNKQEIDAMLSGGGGSTDYGAVGSVIFAGDSVRNYSGGGGNPGDVVPGSRLNPASVYKYEANVAGTTETDIKFSTDVLSGSWRAMSYAQGVGDDFSNSALGVFVRIA